MHFVPSEPCERLKLKTARLETTFYVIAFDYTQPISMSRPLTFSLIAGNVFEKNNLSSILFCLLKSQVSDDLGIFILEKASRSRFSNKLVH